MSSQGLLNYPVVASFDKQLHLAALINGLDWQFDMASGLLSFGSRFSWRAQLLGTESESSGTWLWAWANMTSGIPANLLQASLMMKAFGEKHQFPELTEAEVRRADLDGHFISMIASGICQANAYYRGPYDGGAAFLLIHDDSYPTNTEPPLFRIASVFPQAVSSIEIHNHRLALLAYLASYGILGRSEGRNVIVADDDREVTLKASFDERDRLIKLDAQFENCPL